MIAVLADEYGDYRQVIVDHIADRLASAGYGLLCIVGRELQSDAQRNGVCNAIYPMLNHYPVQGVISMSGAIGHSVTLQRLQNFLQQFELPLVSLGIALDTLPSVAVNDLRGMAELMEHLLADATRRQIAFVRGHENDPYSMEREQVFRRKLQEHGLVAEERFFVAGNYDAFESWQVVSSLLRDHPDIDAIVAANDAMALSAAHAVNESGRRIPKDVVVTGFDDTLEATKHSPAITTVRQPLLELAYNSVDLLLDQLNGSRDRSAATVLRVDSELIVRGSTASPEASASVSQLPDQIVLRRQIDTALAGLSAPDGVDLDEIHQALWNTVEQGSTALADCLTRLLAAPLPMDATHWWSNLCHQAESHGVALLQATGQSARVPLIHAALAIVHERIWSVNMDHEFRLRRMQSTLSTLQLQMSSCTHSGDILDAMERWLQTIGARRCFLVRFAEPAPTPAEQAILLHVYRDGQVVSDDAEPFGSADLLPEQYRAELASGSLILNPVYAGNDLYGYLLIDPAGLEALHLDSTAHSIGNAMRSQYLMHQLEQQASSLQQVNRELVQLANHDALTGLPNRLQFQQRLNSRCESAGRDGERFALLFIDLDGFKHINDTLGHDVGDLLLQTVAKRLKRVIQFSAIEDTTISRLGGDEFTVILGPIDSDDRLVSVIDSILQTLGSTFTMGQHPVNISASIGCTMYPDNSRRAEVLVKQADTAMYHAKERGKNGKSFYNNKLNRSTDVRFELDQEMREALLNGDFCMHFQPRVDLATGKICALEALMRWFVDTPQGARVRAGPDIFIALAEKTGFIVKLDDFALDESCRQARVWELAGTPVQVSVNVSAVQLQQDDFVEKVAAVVARHQLDPALLELEITESAIMGDVEQNARKLAELRDTGIRISVDDFGTGYSSLNYLKKLPLNYLKIDRSFLEEIQQPDGGGSADAAIVRSVVALGASMDLGLIAEGVETDTQRLFLLSIGCHQAQGFLFSRPLPAESITPLLRRNIPLKLVA